MADQLPAEQAPGYGQAPRTVDVQRVLKVTLIRVSVVLKPRIGDSNRFAGILAGQNPFLIAGKYAVPHDKRCTLPSILVPNTRAVTPQ